MQLPRQRCDIAIRASDVLTGALRSSLFADLMSRAGDSGTAMLAAASANPFSYLLGLNGLEVMPPSATL